MQEELITFKTAKLAKEKGFANGTKGCFIVYKEDDINPKGDKGTKKGEFEYCKRFSLKNGELDSDEDYNYLERPTQSLLQKWLREQYRLHITVNVGLPHNCPIMYYSNVIKFGMHHKSKFKSKFFNTYEEALEVGLLEALKLI